MLYGAKIPIISFFSGAGGLDLGFEQAGFAPLVAYDIHQPAIETYNYNRETPIARIGDLVTLEAKTIIADIQRAHGDVSPMGVIGGPPCQAFSQSNVYPKEDDIRRTLPGHYAALLKILNTHYNLHFFVFENVRGITFKRHIEEFGRFRFLFEEAGFHISEALLNAKDYGVAQNRPRVFIIGLNKDLYCPDDFTFPPLVATLPRAVRDAFQAAFGTLPGPEPAFYRRELHTSDIPFHPNHWTMTPRSHKFQNGYLKQEVVRSRCFRVLHWDKPSWTVAYGHREIHVHPSGTRRLSIFEAMLLQGFPTSYILRGNLSDQVKLVSDAVPPPLARHIAIVLLRTLTTASIAVV